MAGGRRVARVCLVAACLVWVLPATASAGPPASRTTYRGLSLRAALEELRSQGLPIFFTSNLVLDSMQVESEPLGDAPRKVLDELLRPHGLRAEPGPRAQLVVVAAARADAMKPPEPPDEEGAVFEEEIVVRPGEIGDPLSGEAGLPSVSRAAVIARPAFGEDPFRAIGGLPGATRRETSARVQARGGTHEDLLVLLDGFELLGPYHLQDFDSALSIVPATAIERADLVAGGYPAVFGDRLGGVLRLTTIEPARAPRFAVGVGTLYGEVTGSGAIVDRGGWYGSARGGSYRLALELDGRRADPRFWDTFDKVEYELRPGQLVRLATLMAEDDFGPAAIQAGGEVFSDRSRHRYGWLTYDGLLGSSLLLETMLSVGEIERNRSGVATGPQAQFAVEDRRNLGLLGGKQVWHLEPRGRASGVLGYEARRLSATADYRSERWLDEPLTSLRTRPSSGSSLARTHFHLTQSSAFASGNLRPRDDLSVELGARYDRQDLTGDSSASPRLNLAWRPLGGTIVRLAWGSYSQGQRPNELQVEDDVLELQPAERAEHRSLAFEQSLAGGASLRVEAFQRRLQSRRSRFENLLDPVSVFPEMAADRVLVTRTAARFEGLEASYRSQARRPWAWSLSYTYSSAREAVAGRQTPQPFDQPHAVHAGASYRTSSGWSVDAQWLWHTGWPTTEVGGRLVSTAEGVTVEPVLGPRNDRRLPAYHRLDVRVRRAWDLPMGKLSAYLEAQNLYDRANVRGFSRFAPYVGGEGRAAFRSEAVSWGGLVPSLGLRWEW